MLVGFGYVDWSRARLDRLVGSFQLFGLLFVGTKELFVLCACEVRKVDLDDRTSCALVLCFLLWRKKKAGNN